MKTRMLRTFLMVSALLIPALSLHAAGPEHFYNDPANLNPDPNYTPGEYPLADVYAAQAAFFAAKAEMIDGEAIAAGTDVTTSSIGEITFSSIKNETATVLGYFRSYLGVGHFNQDVLEGVDMLIDINSLDTAVPGRNHRILNIFFESMKSQFGHAAVHFDTFDGGAKKVKKLKDGQSLTLAASGSITLNGATRPLSANLMIKKQAGKWMVETVEPIELMISDFAFGDRIYALMKECNHKSIGNRVDVRVKVYFS